MNNILDCIVNTYNDDKLMKASGFDDAVIGFDSKSMRLINLFNI